MIDPNLFVREADAVAKALASRQVETGFIEETAALVVERREAQQAKEAEQAALNQATASFQAERAGLDAAQRQAAVEALKAQKAAVQAKERAYAAADARYQARMLEVPNLPADEVPEGANEQANVEVRRVGTPRTDGALQPHWELAESLGLIDFGRAAAVAGPRFAYLLGDGARLERALAQFMLDRAHARGFREVAPPLLVRPQAMQYSGQYPKFVGESFATLDDEYVLVPTSEVPLVSLHANEIVADEELPLRYTALTPCFRREAGAAGRDTRGYLRQHQFYKVELVAFTLPEQSAEEHQNLVAGAADVLETLELPYRVMHLARGDMGFAAKSTFDLEVWLPGQNAYREISSCSNCGDFQARRAQIRSRRGGRGGDAKHRPQLVHTLNGSALAVGRTLVAVLENYQESDGTITVPRALRPYLNGCERLTSNRRQ